MNVARARIHNPQIRQSQIVELNLGQSLNEFSCYKWIRHQGIPIPRQRFYGATTIIAFLISSFTAYHAVLDFLNRDSQLFIPKILIATIAAAISYLAFHAWRIPARYDHVLQEWVTEQRAELSPQYRDGHFAPQEITNLIIQQELGKLPWEPMPFGNTWHVSLKPAQLPESIRVLAPTSSRLYAYTLSDTTYLLRVEIPLAEFWLGNWYTITANHENKLPSPSTPRPALSQQNGRSPSPTLSPQHQPRRKRRSNR